MDRLCRRGCMGLWLALAACSASRPLDTMSLQELRYRAVANPQDAAVRESLGIAEYRAGRPGAALHYLGGRSLGGRARAIRGELYLARAQERMLLADARAIDDVDLASRDGFTADPVLVKKASRLAIIEATHFGRQPDRKLRKRLDVEDPLRTPVAPRAASLATNEDRGLALWRGGAYAAARPYLERAFSQGSERPDVLKAWISVRAWWGGPSLDLLDLRRLGGQAWRACFLAQKLGDLGCDRALQLAVRRDQVDSLARARLFIRGESLGWRTASTTDAEPWLYLCIDAWLARRTSSWEQCISQFVDIPKLLQGSSRLSSVHPTLTRIHTGRHDTKAITDIVAQLNHASASVSQSLVLLAEACLQDLPSQTLKAIYHQLRSSKIAWRVMYRCARRRDDQSLLAEVRGRSPSPRVGAEEMALAGDFTGAAAVVRKESIRLARRYQLDADLLAALAGDATGTRRDLMAMPNPLVGLSAHRRVASTVMALEQLSLVLAREPAAAGQRARSYLFRRPSSIFLADIGALYDSLGRFGDSAKIYEALIDQGSRREVLRLAAFRAKLADGAPRKAWIHLRAAVGAASSPGQVFAWAARIYNAESQSVFALRAGREAVSLLPQGQQVNAWREILAAAEKLGRTKMAAVAKNYLRRLGGEPALDTRGRLGNKPPLEAIAIERALRWNPTSPGLWERLAGLSGRRHRAFVHAVIAAATCEQGCASLWRSASRLAKDPQLRRNLRTRARRVAAREVTLAIFRGQVGDGSYH